MRLLVAALIALVGCGRGDSDADRARAQAAQIEPDERCDPSEPKVCVGDYVTACEPEGKLGRRLRACRDGCRDGACITSCETDGVELIYVVDSARNFMSFDPRKLPKDPFTLIGKLNCGRAFGSPFSMSIDRHGVAWVVYDDGELYKVSIADARCSRSGFTAGSSGSSTFGMGFVTDEAGGKTEKLYIANNDGSHVLSAIDTNRSTPTASAVGRIDATHDQNPELTGTSEGKLFGFFPGSTGPSFVQEIDRKSGASRGTRWNLGTDALFITAYAFAHWGGTFYIFITANGTTTVRTINRKTGDYQTVIDNIPYRITGAGVSTCAPEQDGGKSARGSAAPP
ncbi:MAG: hypothetical protein WKG01_01550 [Kofleriaceae bacterium]